MDGPAAQLHGAAKPLPDLARGYLSLRALTQPALGIIFLALGAFLVAPLMTVYSQPEAAMNGLPLFGLFILCVILVPASGLAQSLSVRRVEREYGPAGVAAL